MRIVDFYLIRKQNSFDRVAYLLIVYFYFLLLTDTDTPNRECRPTFLFFFLFEKALSFKYF